MPSKSKTTGWSSSLRKGFNLTAETEEEQPALAESAEAPLPPAPAQAQPAAPSLAGSTSPAPAQEVPPPPVPVVALPTTPAQEIAPPPPVPVQQFAPTQQVAPAAPVFQEPLTLPTPETDLYVAPVDLMPLTGTATRPEAPAPRERGRPKSTVERIPKTVYLTPSAELALRRSVEQVQDLRGRRRGVLKVQESEIANFALEYLYRRMQQGSEAADSFYLDYIAQEKNSSGG